MMPDRSGDIDITPDLVIDKLLLYYPKVAEIFVAHRMFCVGCYIGRFHTLADVAAIYRIELADLLQEIRLHVRANSASTHD